MAVQNNKETLSISQICENECEKNVEELKDIERSSMGMVFVDKIMAQKKGEK